MEKIIVEVLISHLESNNLISVCQHGFLRRRGCVTNLLESLDRCTIAVAKGINVDVILLDFAKAFDKVWHAGLISKLQALGVSGKLLSWVEDFLRLRKQRVVLGEHNSEWGEVQSGVPQGSVLGPILFVLFINDMPNELSARVSLHLYADDSKLVASLNDPNSVALTQAEIDKLVNWTDKWLMELNLDKCKVLHLSSHSGEIQQPPYIIRTEKEANSIVESSKSERDLGVQVTSDLKWHTQSSLAASKASRVLGSLGRMFVSRDVKLWRKLNVSLVHPHLEYAFLVWAPYHSGDKKDT